MITLHVPLLKETYHMINADTLSKMKKGIVLINCARGALTDIKALISGIESEHIGALGLDCMESGPPAEPVACSAPIRGYYLLAPGRRTEGLPAAPHPQQPLKGLIRCFLTPAQPLKGLAGLL